MNRDKTNPVADFACNVVYPITACGRPLSENMQRLVKLIYAGLPLVTYERHNPE